MQRSDIASGIFLTLFSLITIFFVVPNQISGSSEYGIAPDVFPLTLLWAASIFAALLCAMRLLSKIDRDEPAPMGAQEFKFIGAMTAFLTVLVVIISNFGFIVGGVVTIALLMLLMGERQHPLRLVLVSALTPLILYFIFWSLFRVPLP